MPDHLPPDGPDPDGLGPVDPAARSSDDPAPEGSEDASPEAGKDPLDVDAAFARIVAGWDSGAGTTSEHSALAPPPASPPPTPDPERLQELFAPRWRDSLDDEATWDDEGHFVPPPPPPLPFVEPRRLAAWVCLFGAPTLGLVLMVAGVPFGGLLGYALGLAFVGGFVYLVATMPPTRGEHGEGNDGAVI